jgi:hypothetical protein
MKKYFSILILVVFSLEAVNAQDSKENSIGKFSNPYLVKGFKDSIPKSFQFHIDSLITPKDENVSIPNALENKKIKVDYNMPIKKLSGKNLAPMPGTENLDKSENIKAKDSLIRKIPYKK